MKKLWNWKWRSVPMGIVSAVLILALVAGSAFAAYTVWTHHSAEIVVLESIEVLTENDNQEGWPHPDNLHFLPETIYPGQGTCETYLIHNVGPVPISITVTMTEPAGTELAGLALQWANSTADFLRESPVLLSGETPKELSYTFTIGTYEYDGMDGSGGEVYTSAKGDSAFVKVFAGFKVLEDAEPGPFDITVTVGRG